MGPPFVKAGEKETDPTLGGAVFEKINRDHDRDGGDPSRQANDHNEIAHFILRGCMHEFKQSASRS